MKFYNSQNVSILKYNSLRVTENSFFLLFIIQIRITSLKQNMLFNNTMAGKYLPRLS